MLLTRSLYSKVDYLKRKYSIHQHFQRISIHMHNGDLVSSRHNRRSGFDPQFFHSIDLTEQKIILKHMMKGFVFILANHILDQDDPRNHSSLKLLFLSKVLNKGVLEQTMQ